MTPTLLIDMISKQRFFILNLRNSFWDTRYIDFFYSFFNLVPDIEKLKYRKPKRLKFSFSRFKTLRIGHSCTFNGSFLVQFEHQGNKKENFNRLAL